MRNPSIDVLGVGTAAIDDVIYVERAPVADEKLEVVARSREYGGLTATAVVAAARLGVRTSYAGSLGYDASSREVLRDLRAAGVRVPNGLRRTGAGPILATVICDLSSGTRTIFYTLPELDAAAVDIPEAVIRDCRVLLVDGFAGTEGVLRAAAIARRHAIPVVGDLERQLDGPFPELLGTIDHLVVPKVFAMAFSNRRSPQEAIEQLWTASRQAIVVTAGAEGCWFKSGPDSTVQRLEAYPVAAIDTTGCGDVFHGAYAAELARGSSPPAAVRFASVAAALSATELGTRSGLPTRSRVEHCLRQWPARPQTDRPGRRRPAAEAASHPAGGKPASRRAGVKPR